MNEGDWSDCKNCNKRIACIETRHNGLMWVHEANGSQQCTFVAEPSGPKLYEPHPALTKKQ